MKITDNNINISYKINEIWFYWTKYDLKRFLGNSCHPHASFASIFIFLHGCEWFTNLLNKPLDTVLKAFACERITGTNMPRFIFDLFKTKSWRQNQKRTLKILYFLAETTEQLPAAILTLDNASGLSILLAKNSIGIRRFCISGCCIKISNSSLTTTAKEKKK